MASVSIVRWIVYLAIILLPIHGNITYQNGNVRVAADCSAWYSEKNATAYDVRADWDTTVHLGSFDVCRVEVHGPCTGAKAKGTGKAEARSKNTITIQGNPRRLEYRTRRRSERSEIEADERKNKPNECDTYSGYVEVKLVEWQDEACRMELRVLDETKTRNEGKVVLEKKSNCAWDTWTQQEQLNIETEQEQQQQEHNQNQEPEREHEPNQEAETEAQEQKVQLQKSDKSEGNRENREMKGVRVKLDEGHYLVVELKVGNVVSWQRQADRSRFAMELGVTFEVDESETKAGDKCVKCVEDTEDEEVKNNLRLGCEGHEQARRHAHEPELELARLGGKFDNVSTLGEHRQSSKRVESGGFDMPIQFKRRLRRQASIGSDIGVPHLAKKELFSKSPPDSPSWSAWSFRSWNGWTQSANSWNGWTPSRSSWNGWTPSGSSWNGWTTLGSSWNGWTTLGSSWNGWTTLGSSWNGWTPSENLSPDSNAKSRSKQSGSVDVLMVFKYVGGFLAFVVFFITVYKILSKYKDSIGSARRDGNSTSMQRVQQERPRQNTSGNHVQLSSSTAWPVRSSRCQSYGLQQAATASPTRYVTVNSNDWHARMNRAIYDAIRSSVTEDARHSAAVGSPSSSNVSHNELRVGGNGGASRRHEHGSSTGYRTPLGFELSAEDSRMDRSSSMPSAVDSHSCEVPLLYYNQHLNETLATSHLNSTHENVDAPPSFEEAVQLPLPTHGPSRLSNLSDAQPPPYEQAVRIDLAQSNNEHYSSD